ncbi:hypothetical protein [Limosilactobacillus allomucosae]|uniref:CS domain-containing protein n=1 Tax=Limosilactobacillus allomucosae TaxID=3142938 RepID=A0AAU7C696_9LACO
MSFALLYRSLSRTRWYWSVSQNFTQKSERQFTWESAADLAADYPKLRSRYPTLFAKKRAEAFWIYDLAHDDATRLSLAAADSADVPADDAPQAEANADKTIAVASPTAADPMALQTSTPKQQESDPKTAEHFALMVDDKNNASCYYSRTLKKFVVKVNEHASVWDRRDSAIDVGKELAINDSFWLGHAEYDRATLRLVRVEDGERIWPQLAGDGLPMPDPELIDQFREKISAHVDDDGPAASTMSLAKAAQHEVETIDFERFNLKKILEAVDYLIDALRLKATAERQLKVFDQSILQDYLHVIELTELDQIDTQQLVASLQSNRRARRQIKDLKIILSALAKSFDVQQFLNILLSEPSLGSQYYFRDQATAAKIKEMID